jgi:predicted nucleic acid-binding protein
VIIADTSGLLALYNRTEPAHEAVSAVVSACSREIAVSPFVIAELDYLVATRVGVDAELLVLRELASGAYLLAPFDAPDLSAARSLVEQYRDQRIGLADASLVVLADRYATRDILTLDHRHFDVLRPLAGGQFQVHPA